MKHAWLSILLCGCLATSRHTHGAPSAEPATSASPTEALGSTRNARVALPRGVEREPLTYFAGELTPEELA